MRPIELEKLPWDPISPEETNQLLQGIGAIWWFAGGWAIEFFVGENFRNHDDTDVSILRKDQMLFREALTDWEVYASDPPGQLRPWPLGETLPTTVTNIWCRKDSTSHWSLQIMLNDGDDDQLIYKRNPKKTWRLTDILFKNGDGLTYLAPEVQLLYKSKGSRDKDFTDFNKCWPKLSNEKQQWLLQAIAEYTDQNHPWLKTPRS